LNWWKFRTTASQFEKGSLDYACCSGVWGNGCGSVTTARLLQWSTLPKAKSWELKCRVFSLSPFAIRRWLQRDWYLLSYSCPRNLQRERTVCMHWGRCFQSRTREEGVQNLIADQGEGVALTNK